MRGSLRETKVSLLAKYLSTACITKFSLVSIKEISLFDFCSLFLCSSNLALVNILRNEKNICCSCLCINKISLLLKTVTLLPNSTSSAWCSVFVFGIVCLSFGYRALKFHSTWLVAQNVNFTIKISIHSQVQSGERTGPLTETKSWSFDLQLMYSSLTLSFGQWPVLPPTCRRRNVDRGWGLSLPDAMTRYRHKWMLFLYTQLFQRICKSSTRFIKMWWRFRFAHSN